MAEKRIQFNLGQAVQNQLLADGVTLEQITYYDRNGITAVSNNNNVVKRDEAGNIDIEDDSNLLIIEPIDIKITNRSMLQVLDTQFNHFKFPARIAIEEEPELDLDLNLDFSGLETNNIDTELKLPVPLDDKNQPNGYDRISTTTNQIWFYDFESSGPKQLAFTGGTQPVPNAYTITKSTIDELNTKGKTLKFTVQIQFRSVEDERCVYRVSMNRNNPKSYRNFNSFVLHTESGVSGQDGATTNPWGFTVKTRDSDYPVIFMEYYVDMTDVQPGDSYVFSAESSKQAWSLNQNAYWLVEIADIPNTPGLYGWSDGNSLQNAGIYSVSNDILVRLPNGTNLFTKTNNEINFIDN